MLRRFRVWLAVLLVRGTKCLVAREEALSDLIEWSDDLYRYSRVSGGLNDPRRIKAYKRIGYSATAIQAAANRLLAGQPIDLLQAPQPAGGVYDGEAAGEILPETSKANINEAFALHQPATASL